MIQVQQTPETPAFMEVLTLMKMSEGSLSDLADIFPPVAKMAPWVKMTIKGRVKSYESSKVGLAFFQMFYILDLSLFTKMMT